MKANSWLLKPVASICAAVSLLVFSIVIAFNRNKDAALPDSSVYTITLKHYGVNAREMERTAAIPLEDALYSIDNVKDVITISENGSVRAYSIFKQKRKGLFSRNTPAGTYEAVSEAAQKVYETLPSSAQRPEIISASETRIPVWTAAVTAVSNDLSLNTFIEKTIKPRLSTLDGVAEVEISGTGVNEIVISLMPEAAAASGITAHFLAGFLSENDKTQNAGTIEENGRDILVTVDGRYKDLNEMQNAMIPLADGSYMQLKYIANVFEHEREPDTYSRVNGRKMAVISIMPQPDASLGKLSKSIRREIEAIEKYNIKIHVLSDLGKEDSDAYRSVFLAGLQGSLIVSLITAFLNSGKKQNSKLKNGLVCALSVPYICIISAALLMVLGLPLDKILLAGIATGVGAAVDTAILCGEKLNNVNSLDEGRLKLRELRIPLASGSLTTIISLLPLVSLPFVSGDILKIVYSIAAVNFVSLFIALAILPPLFMAKNDAEKSCMAQYRQTRIVPNIVKILRKFLRNTKYFTIRLLGRNILLCIKRPVYVCAVAAVMTLAGVIAVILSGTDTSKPSSEGTVFAQIEFDGGIVSEEVDEILSIWANKIKEHEGITNVQTSSKVSQASALISYNPALITKSEVGYLSRNEDAGGGFVYITEAAHGKQTWTIQFSGSDDNECRRLAREAASLCLLIPSVEDVVLNFKDGSNNITIKPDRKKISELGTNRNRMSIFNELASAARWGIHGPVAYKRIAGETASNSTAARGETDVRIRALGAANPSRNDVENLLLAADDEDGGINTIRLKSVVNITDGKEPSAIRRDGRRRTASISIRTKVMDARRARDLVMPLIDKIKMPDTYSAEFDREAVKDAEAINDSMYYFIAAVIFCYMIIAAINESFVIPLIVLAVIPPSLSVPVICLVLSGNHLNTAIVCSLIAVCGMTVNSSVIAIGALNLTAKKQNDNRASYSRILYFRIRKVIPLIASTGITTIISAVPFLFLKEGVNELIRTLSFITVTGVAASCIYSIGLVPALAVSIKKYYLEA
jgi:multidrug efflux pump subunit AcrB